MARYSDTDLSTLDTSVGIDQSGIGALVEAPRQNETDALLVDMSRQTLPIKFQGKDVYKDPQGNFRYGLAQGTEPKKTRFSDSDLNMESKKESQSLVGNVVGSTAMVGDMILGFPAFVGGFVANLAAAGGSAAGGATREEAWAEGRKAQEAFMTGGPLAGWQSSPLGKLAELLGHKDTYEGSSVGEAMTKVSSAIEDAGKWVEEKSGGSIPKDSVLTFADSLMVGMGPAAARLIKGVKGNLVERRAREGEVLPPEGGERVEPTINNGVTIEGQPLTPEALAKQHVEARYADPTLQGPAAAQFWRDRGGEMRNTFDDPLARRQYEQAKRALVKERKNAVKSPATVVEERLAADPPMEGTPQEILKQYKEEVLGQPAESTRISEGDATRLYQTPPALRTTEQRLQLKRYESGLRTEGMFGPGSVADQVKSYASKNPGVTGAALGAVAGGIAYLNSDEGDSVLPAVMASFMPVAFAHPRVKLAQHLEKIGAPRDRIWTETQLFKNEHGQWVKEIHNTDAGLNPNLPRVPGDPGKVIPGHLESGVPLGDILQDRRLYMNMPELADIPVLEETGKNFRGSFNTKAGVMRLRPGEPEQVKSTALHETQHAIQTERGMPGGGNPEQFLSAADSAFIREAEMRTGVLEGSIRKDTGAFDAALVQQAVEQVQKGQRMSAAVAREFNKIQNHPALPEYLRALEDRIKADDLYMAAREKYLRLPGEVEARVVQARMNMTPVELRTTPPWKTYGINAEGWPTKLAVGAAAVAAGGWMFLDEDAAEKIGVGGLVLAGAIKGKGGMWHPEAVTRLSDPLAKSMLRSGMLSVNDFRQYPAKYSEAALKENRIIDPGLKQEMLKDIPFVVWSDKAVKNWLNKHAGTATDPLKDVKVPMLGDDVRWEDLTDTLIRGDKYELGEAKSDLRHIARPGEAVWNIEKPRSWDNTEQPVMEKLSALQSYISHAGDYAREFIPVDKLQQYDLVRLIKETATLDEKAKLEMAKGRVAKLEASKQITSELPPEATVKAYPDGSAWYKIDKTLTDEQIKLNTSIDTELCAICVGGVDHGKWGYKGYVPARNIVTRKKAHPNAPETNDYIESIKNGEIDVYSLRDANGETGATVEVALERPRVNTPADWFYDWATPKQQAALPTRPTNDLNNNLGNWIGIVEASPGYQMYLETMRTATPKENIVQIKGVENKSLVGTPYEGRVQDFVKSSKWGDVGDLRNAGLRDIDFHAADPKSFGPGQLEAIRKMFPGQRYLSEADISKAIEADHAVPKGQRGSIDPNLVKKLGAGVAGAAIGAYLDKDERLSAGLVGGALGMLGAAALGRAKGRGEPVNRGIDYVGGNISTRMGNLGEMGPAIKKRFRDFERKVMEETKAVTDKVGPFLQDLKGLPGAVKEQVSLALLQQDVAKVKQLLAGSAQTLANFEVVQRVLQDFERAHKQLGRFKEGITDYFPRIVSDYEGLQKALGAQAGGALDDWLNKAEKKMLKDEKRLLTPVEESILINRYLLAEAPLSSLPQHLHQRTVRQVTQALQPFYEAPEISLSRYVHAAVQDIELAKLFGRNLKLSKASHGTRAINIDESIGAFVRDARAVGKLTASQEAQLKEIMRSRFGPGEQGARPFWQNVRNVANIGLLGNLISATTQVGDIAMAYYAFGLRSTMNAVGKTLTGKAIDPREYGLANHISEEFATTVGSAKALQKMFKYSGFSAVDMLGKKIILNAALDRYQRMSKTTKGQERIAEKYQAAYGSEFADLLRDLRNGTRSDNVNSLLFSELSDLQPISKMEMPQAYLDMPNGRVVYMLKSFMLKQMDLVRRDIFQEFAKGHTQRALSNLTRYAITVGVAGATVQMVKDMILGKPLKAPEWDDVALNVMKTFGWSKYTLDKAKSGRPIEAMVGIVMPPYAMMDDAIRRDPKALAYIPPVGKLYYERNKDKWKEQRAWDKKHDPDLRMERRMKRLEERQ